MKNKELPVWCKGMDESGIWANTIILPVSTHIRWDAESDEPIDYIIDDNGQAFSQEQTARALNFFGKQFTLLTKRNNSV